MFSFVSVFHCLLMFELLLVSEHVIPALWEDDRHGKGVYTVFGETGAAVSFLAWVLEKANVLQCYLTTTKTKVFRNSTSGDWGGHGWRSDDTTQRWAEIAAVKSAQKRRNLPPRSVPCGSDLSDSRLQIWWPDGVGLKMGQRSEVIYKRWNVKGLKSSLKYKLEYWCFKNKHICVPESSLQCTAVCPSRVTILNFCLLTSVLNLDPLRQGKKIQTNFLFSQSSLNYLTSRFWWGFFLDILSKNLNLSIIVFNV